MITVNNPSSAVSGASTQVQFNDGGVLGATSGLTFAKATNALSVTGSVIVPVLAAASTGNVNLILSPTGSGAIQTQVVDNTATGGNARGTYSVDLQRVRTLATQVASGSYSFASGSSNTASSQYSFAFGSGNTASGQYSFAFGASITASGYCSFAAGQENTASGFYSSAFGVYALARLTSQFALSCQVFNALGKCQYNIFPLGASTTDATPKTLTADGSNGITLQNNSAMRFNIMVIANVTGGGNTSGWEIKGVIKRGANAASTALVGLVTTTLIAQDVGASGWAIAATANTTTGGLTITATGQASTTIRWTATVDCAEVAF